MTPIPFFFTIGFDPKIANRSMKSIISKELAQAKTLRALMSTFVDAVSDSGCSYEDTFNIYNSQWKKEAYILNDTKKLKSFRVNIHYFEEMYGFDKKKVKNFKSNINILNKFRQWN